MRIGSLGLYFRYMRMHVYGAFSYSGWPIAYLLVLIHSITDPLEIVLLVARFKQVGAYSGWQIALVYSMAILCFGLAELCARGFDYFPSLVRQGEFDRILLRPRGTIVQVLGLKFHPHRIVRAAFGGIMAGVAMGKLGIVPTAADAVMLFLAVIGGTITYSAIFMLGSALSFWFIEDIHFLYIFTNGSYQVAKVPPAYLPTWLFRLFTLVVPMFAFCYFPAAVVGGWGVAAWTGWMALPAGLLFLAVAMGVWKLGRRHYAGAGS